MKPLQSLLRLAVVTWVLDGIAKRVGVECLETYINADFFPCREMFNHPLSLDTELHVEPVCSFDNAHSFDLLEWEGFNVLLGITHKPEPANATAIGEADMAPIVFQ